MATHRATKVLRVGIIQNGRVIEEKLLSRRESVSVGQRLRNTFVLANSEAPQRFTMFQAKRDGYALSFTERMDGRIFLGDGVFDLKALRESGRAKRAGEAWAVSVSDRSRGTISVGDVTILYQFVSEPPLGTAPRLPANMRGNLPSFLASALGLEPVLASALLSQLLLQAGGILALSLLLPPPPREIGYAEVSDRFLSAMHVDLTPDSAVSGHDEFADRESTPGTATPATEASGEPVPSRAHGEAEPALDATSRSSDATRSETRARVIRESALVGFFAGGRDADGPALGITTSLSERRAEEVIARQQTMHGATRGDGIVSTSGLGSSQGAGGDVDRGLLPAGQGGAELLSGLETGGTTDRDGITVYVRYAIENEQIAGRGRIEPDSLQSVLRRRQRDIEHCYERGLAHDPGLGGRAEVQFTVGTDGLVEDARVRDSELGSAVDRCIASAVRRWRFDAPLGGNVTVRRTYVFTSRE